MLQKRKKSLQKILVVPLKAKSLAVCIDANVYISGIAFGGNPLKIVERALNRDLALSHHRNFWHGLFNSTGIIFKIIFSVFPFAVLGSVP